MSLFKFCQKIFILFLFFLCFVYGFDKAQIKQVDKRKVVYAINAGGGDFVDSHGIYYKRDPCKEGIASSYGENLPKIKAVYPGDDVLYKTERYSTKDFGYDIKVNGDGEYFMILKFSEVYFNSERMKIFDVALNGVKVIDNLDIFAEAGNGIAHDELVQFRITEDGSNLLVGDYQIEIQRNTIRLDFQKSQLDNPKINAILIIKGEQEDVPYLPGYIIEGDEEEEDDNFEFEDFSQNSQQNEIFSKNKIASGIPANDPWEEESNLTMLFPLIMTFVFTFITMYFSKKYLVYYY